MARIDVLPEDVTVDEPTLVEGLPGVGLVGKIAADHLVELFDMVHYANVYCEGIPRVVVYEEGDARLRTPLRLYADPERSLVVLQSDVPISPPAATEFADCLASWLEGEDATSIYLSGIPREKDESVPSVYGVAADGNGDRLTEAGIDVPSEAGLISGPTGALLNHAIEEDLNAVGLVVDSDPQFPDPEAARAIITQGIEPLTGLEIDTDELVEHAESIRDAREQLAERIQEGDEEVTQAQPIRGFQ